MSGSFKPYFYFILRAGAVTNGLQKCVKPFRVIGDGEDICQDFTFWAEDKAVVLVLGNVNSNTNHEEYLRPVFDAGSTGHFTLVTLFQINRLAVSNWLTIL